MSKEDGSINYSSLDKAKQLVPPSVLFVMAMAVIMVTAGIVYVLVSHSATFFNTIGCGHSEINLQDDWDERQSKAVSEAAIWMEGEITDPLWANSNCISGWDLNYSITLYEPMYIEDNPDTTVDESADMPEWVAGRKEVPLWQLVENESIILPVYDESASREWFSIQWADEDIDNDGIDNEAYTKNILLSVDYDLSNTQNSFVFWAQDGLILKNGYIENGEGKRQGFTEDGNEYWRDVSLVSLTRHEMNIEAFSEGYSTISLIISKDSDFDQIYDPSDEKTTIKWSAEKYLETQSIEFDEPSITGNYVSPSSFDTEEITVTVTSTLLDDDIDGDAKDNERDRDRDGDGILDIDEPETMNYVEPDTIQTFISLILFILILFLLFFPFSNHKIWKHIITQNSLNFGTIFTRSASGIAFAISLMSMLYPPENTFLLYLTLPFLAWIVWSYYDEFIVGKTKKSVGNIINSLGDAFSVVLMISVFLITRLHESNPVLCLLVSTFGITLAISLDDASSSGVNELQPTKPLRRAINSRRNLFISLSLIALWLLFLSRIVTVTGAIGEFLFQTEWIMDPNTSDRRTLGASSKLGVNALLSTTLQVAVGALLIAIPIGMGTAIWLSEYANPKVTNFLKPILELLAGVPSVVYGFFAVIFISPIVMDVGLWLYDHEMIDAPPNHFNALNGAIVVGFMVTPLIASLSEDALRSVPRSLREASLALGATSTETTRKVVIPASLSGIIASILLAFSRAVGETMAVTIAVGTAAIFTTNMFLSSQTMTSFIAQRVSGDAVIESAAYQIIFAVGLYLFVITLSLNLLGNYILSAYREEYE